MKHELVLVGQQTGMKARTQEERQSVERAARFGLAALDHRELE